MAIAPLPEVRLRSTSGLTTLMTAFKTSNEQFRPPLGQRLVMRDSLARIPLTPVYHYGQGTFTRMPKRANSRNVRSIGWIRGKQHEGTVDGGGGIIADSPYRPRHLHCPRRRGHFLFPPLPSPFATALLKLQSFWK